MMPIKKLGPILPANAILASSQDLEYSDAWIDL
jgi:hypothetical protein